MSIFHDTPSDRRGGWASIVSTVVKSLSWSFAIHIIPETAITGKSTQVQQKQVNIAGGGGGGGGWGIERVVK